MPVSGGSDNVTFYVNKIVGCLMNVPATCTVSLERICRDNCTYCHTEIQAVSQTCHLTQSQYTDTRSTSPGISSVTPDIIIMIIVIIILIIMMMMIINLTYIAHFDTNGILTALYMAIKYIQTHHMH